MESDFVQAWNAYFSSRKATLTEAQATAYERFALSNRDRARTFIDSVQSQLKLDFKNKRVLDIGSAYGGFVICCAQMGAVAYGVEILEYLHQLALANARNETGQIKLINMDILDQNILAETDNQPFDLIIIDDVFEHIYDSLALFNRIKSLSHTDTVVYFAIPNGGSWQGIENEGHKFQFGLTLLEPGAWPKELGPFSIYYRPLEFYQLYFHHIGFPHLYLMIEEDKLNTSRERVLAKFADLETKVASGPFPSDFHNEHARRKFHLLKQHLTGIIDEDPLRVHILYDQYFWQGYATQRIIPDLENKDSLARISFEALTQKETSDTLGFLKRIKHRLFS